jgi:hypothetical protein
MKKGGLIWFVGLLSFIALMCAGTVWLLGLAHVTGGVIAWIGNIAGIILSVIALVCGFLWLRDTKMNKTLKIVLMVFFIIFAVLAVLGYLNIGI